MKRYKEAQKVLDHIVNDATGRREILVQIRRIELASMLSDLDKLRDQYVRELEDSDDPLRSELFVALAEQHGEFVTPSESIGVFQDLIKRGGPAAGAYYGIGYGMESQGNHERAVYNYEQSLKADPDWYLSYFGLSQIYYQQGDETKGDHFFYLFEKSAPYNVYGNFETHRSLYQEFLEQDRYEEAEAAIVALSEWWTENRGRCPTEIQIYELLAVSENCRGQRGDRGVSGQSF